MNLPRPLHQNVIDRLTAFRIGHRLNVEQLKAALELSFSMATFKRALVGFPLRHDVFEEIMHQVRVWCPGTESRDAKMSAAGSDR